MEIQYSMCGVEAMHMYMGKVLASAHVHVHVQAHSYMVHVQCIHVRTCVYSTILQLKIVHHCQMLTRPHHACAYPISNVCCFFSLVLDEAGTKGHNG